MRARLNTKARVLRRAPAKRRSLPKLLLRDCLKIPSENSRLVLTRVRAPAKGDEEAPISALRTDSSWPGSRPGTFQTISQSNSVCKGREKVAEFRSLIRERP